MNYLAHIYLSGNNEELMIGNFIADSVKGNTFIKYPEGIQNGIILHRAIDTFTDIHPVFRKSASKLFPGFRHYNGVIIDVFYDHFLASNWNQFSEVPLEKYIADFYALLGKNYEILPVRVKNFYPYLLKDNWLLSYATIEGIEKILFQMSQRTIGEIKLNLAVKELNIYYEEFKNEFFSFFPELITYTRKEINDLDLNRKK